MVADGSVLVLASSVCKSEKPRLQSSARLWRRYIRSRLTGNGSKGGGWVLGEGGGVRDRRGKASA
jgi:hypothetical protein